jgi:glycogen synthase
VTATAPRVSVVINTLNRRDHVERSLVALREQTYDDFEVIVVDGPSDDGTDGMLRGFRDRVRTASCRQAAVGPSRNVGIERAAGDVVAFMDDDAVARPHWLETLAAHYRDPEVAAVGGPVFDVPSDAVVWRLCTCTRSGMPVTESEGPPERYAEPGADPFVYLPGCNMSFRRAVLAAVGGFNELLTNAYDDAEVGARLVDRGFQFRIERDVLVDHAFAPNSIRADGLAVRDPYPLLHCRAVFALQTRQPVHGRETVVEQLRGAVEEMVNLAGHYRATGVLDAAQSDRFADRARQGAEDGIRIGSGERPAVTIGPPPRSEFRRYR